MCLLIFIVFQHLKLECLAKDIISVKNPYAKHYWKQAKYNKIGHKDILVNRRQKDELPYFAEMVKNIEENVLKIKARTCGNYKKPIQHSENKLQ